MLDFKRHSSSVSHRLYQYIRLFAVLVTIGIVVLSVSFYQIKDEIPKLEQWQHGIVPHVKHSLSFYDSTQQLLWHKGDILHTPYPIQAIPDPLILSFLASEDHRFFDHWGIDFKSLARVVILKLWRGGRLHGASTITQQVAKMWVGPQRSLRRKIKEAFLALHMEWHWNKYQILEIYLNHIYLGEGSYGVVEAAWQYFGKHLSQLTLAECALLAALPPRPSIINPRKNKIETLMRRNHVLQRLYDLQLITHQQWQQATEEGIQLVPRTPLLDPQLAHYILTAYSHLKSLNIQTGVIELAISLSHQKQAVHSIQKGMTSLLDRQKQKREKKRRERKVRKKEKRRDKTEQTKSKQANKAEQIKGTQANPYTSSASPKISHDFQAALVAMRHSDQAMIALQGSIDFTHSQFNRATQSCRSIASTVKPWIYALALENGWSYNQRVSDAPIAIYDSARQFIWKPRGSYRSSAYGVRLNHALIHSLNLPFIHLTKSLGVAKLYQWLNTLPLKQKEAHLSLSLGTSCSSPLHLNQLYASIMQKGHLHPAYLITSYTPHSSHKLDSNSEPNNDSNDSNSVLSSTLYPSSTIAWDHTLPTQAYLSPKRRVWAMFRQALNVSSSPTPAFLKPNTVKYLQKTLRQVTQKGTAKKARFIPWYSAGKTGSTDLYDAWFTGYYSTHSLTVWVGSDQEKVPLLGGEGGAQTALPIWLDFVKNTAHTSPHDLPSTIYTVFPKTAHQSKKSTSDLRIKSTKSINQSNPPSFPNRYDEILETEGQF